MGHTHRDVFDGSFFFFKNTLQLDPLAKKLPFDSLAEFLFFAVSSEPFYVLPFFPPLFSFLEHLERDFKKCH